MTEKNDYTLPLTVLPSHTDPNGVAKLAALSDMLADCERLHIDNERTLSRYLTENDIGLFQCFRQIDILRRPRRDEQLTVKTRITETKFTSGNRNTFIIDADGQPVVLSYAVGAFVNMTSGRIALIDREFIKSFPQKRPLDMEYTPRKIALPASPSEPLPPYIIPRDYLDSYGHVNNAKYVHQTIEHFDETTVRRIRIEYKTQQKHGDTVHPYIHRDDNRTTLRLTGAADTTYAVVEYSFKE